jgi:hypothetical protein
MTPAIMITNGRAAPGERLKRREEVHEDCLEHDLGIASPPALPARAGSSMTVASRRSRSACERISIASSVVVERVSAKRHRDRPAELLARTREPRLQPFAPWSAGRVVVAFGVVVAFEEIEHRRGSG